MAVVGEVTQVMHLQVDQALLARLADQREIQRGEVLRKDGDDIESQDRDLTARPGPTDPGAGQSRRGHPRRRLPGRSPSRTGPTPRDRRSTEAPAGPGQSRTARR